MLPLEEHMRTSVCLYIKGWSGVVTFSANAMAANAL